MKRQRSCRSIDVAALLALAACGPSSPPAPAAPVITTIDGVRIVENSAQAWTTEDAWRVSAEPTLTIGVDIGERYEMFANIRPPLQLSDGRVVVADDSHELRYFDDAGEFLFARGGAGQGPGEFTYIGIPFRMPGDGVLVANFNAGNMLAFDGAGDHQATLRLQAHELDFTRVTPANVLGVFGDGSLLAESTTRFGVEQFAAGAIGWRHLALFHYLEDGTQPRLLGEFPFMEQAGSGMLDDGSLIFAGRASFATDDDDFFVTDGRSPEIDIYDVEGRLQQRIRWPAAVVEVSGAAKDAYFVLSRANIEDFGGDPQAEARLPKAIFAPTVPLVTRMVVDAEGNLWTKRHSGVARPIIYRNSPRPNEGPAAWDVFSPQGVWLGTVALPAGIYVGQIGTDYVLTGGQGEDGVEHIWKYRLIKP